MPARSATATFCLPTAAACSASPRGARISARRETAPIAPLTRSIGHKASAAATSAGALFLARRNEAVMAQMASAVFEGELERQLRGLASLGQEHPRRHMRL